MEKDLFPLVVPCSTGLTVEMSTKSTVMIVKLKRKQNLISQRIPINGENGKKSIAKDEATKYFWRNDNQLDELYSDITVEESVS